MTAQPETSYDVVIAGAGPAGSSLAIRLANAGFNVLLAEQKKFPREKLCGEFISPECLVHFRELGVMDDLTNAGGSELQETFFFKRNGKGLSVRSEWFGTSDTYALSLSRAEMDTQLLDRARLSGVTVLDETSVSGLVFDNGVAAAVKLKQNSSLETLIYARLIVDATGRTQSLARRLQKQQIKKPADLIAFKTHLRGAAVRDGTCEIYVYHGGYGGCSRVEGDLYNLCFIASANDTKMLGSDAERVMRELVFSNIQAAASLKDATVAKPWLAVPIQRFGWGELVPAQGLISVGDAAAFIDPFTGSGMLLALESSKIAAATIDKSFKSGSTFPDLAKDYRRRYSEAFDKRLRICSMLRRTAFSPLIAETAISFLGLNVFLLKQLAKATRSK